MFFSLMCVLREYENIKFFFYERWMSRFLERRKKERRETRRDETRDKYIGAGAGALNHHTALSCLSH